MVILVLQQFAEKKENFFLGERSKLWIIYDFILGHLQNLLIYDLAEKNQIYKIYWPIYLL